jgi:hypothetical protein
MRKLPAVLLAFALFAPGVAAAQRADISDVRCVITMSGVQGSEQLRVQAMIGAYFFTARVLAAQPGYDFASVRAEAEKMSKLDLQRELSRCGAVLVAAGQKLVTVQSALQGVVPKD